MVFTAPVASTLKARGFLYSELAKFSRAGFGIDKACQSILGQPGADRTAREICAAILAGFQAGKSLADSLKASRYPVSEIEVAMVDAAERGGKLEVGFRHLAEHFRQEHEARRRIRRALIYPIFVLHLALIAGIGITALLRMVHPNAAENAGRDTVTTGLIWAGVGYGMAIILMVIWRNLARAAETSPSVDALLQRMPLAGPVRRCRSLARFCEVLHIYLLSGQRMNLAWATAGAASHSGLLRRFASVGAIRMASGESVSDVVADARGALPGDLVRGFSSADLAGSLDQEAEHWAEFYRAETGENLDRLAEWAPKLFYWFVMIFTAWMIIRMAMGYRDLLQGILDWAP